MTDSPNPTNGWPTLPSGEWIDTIEAVHAHALWRALLQSTG